MDNMYRKKPVVIEAVQYKGNGNFSNHSLPDWIWAAFDNKTLLPTNGTDPLIIKTLEGDLTVPVDDFIIQGVSGEIYPCKPDIFEKTYELVGKPDTESTIPTGVQHEKKMWTEDEVIFFISSHFPYPPREKLLFDLKEEMKKFKEEKI